MSTSLVKIKQILADVEVNVDGVLPRVYPPDNYKRNIESADLPARLIFSSTEGNQHTFAPVGIGNQGTFTWVITDLMLYRTIETGMGWEEVKYVLDQYCADYGRAVMAANRKSYTGGDGFCSVSAEIQSADMLVGEHSWASRDYYGVLVTFTITEKI